MQLQSRNLVFGMQGNDVRELQRDLVWLGFDILSQEITDGRFGETTRAGGANGRLDVVVPVIEETQVSAPR